MIAFGNVYERIFTGIAVWANDVNRTVAIGNGIRRKRILSVAGRIALAKRIVGGGNPEENAKKCVKYCFHKALFCHKGLKLHLVLQAAIYQQRF
jgi:hypothetical protein